MLFGLIAVPLLPAEPQGFHTRRLPPPTATETLTDTFVSASIDNLAPQSLPRAHRGARPAAGLPDDQVPNTTWRRLSSTSWKTSCWNLGVTSRSSGGRSGCGSATSGTGSTCSFFHRRLRCLVVIDLKIGKFTHADAGQMHLYLNYAREHWTNADENPPVGLILCAHKDEAVAHYALEGLPNKVMASEYRLGVTVENRRAKARIRSLRKVPAVLRFLSVEPLLLESLGRIDLTGIGWVQQGLAGPTVQSDMIDVEERNRDG